MGSIRLLRLGAVPALTDSPSSLVCAPCSLISLENPSHSTHVLPPEWAVNHSTSPHGHSNAFIQQIFPEYLLCATHYYSPEGVAINEVPDLMEAANMLVGVG